MSEARDQGLGVDEYLAHSTSSGGSGSIWGKMLKKDWKDAGELEVWLHTRGGIAVPLITHGWYVKRSWEDRATGQISVSVWSDKWVCHEEEEVVRLQYKTDEDDNRLRPPAVCPACMLVDFVGRNIRNGKLHWCEPLFEWAVSGQDRVVLHAGGIVNKFGDKKLTQQEVAEMKSHGIFQSDAWKESMWAKFAYIFRVVLGRDPTECKIAIQSSIMGESMRAVIRDEIAKARRLMAADPTINPNRGNPLLDPYPFSWRHNKNEKNFARKDSALAIYGVKPSEKILELITTGELPDISPLTAKGNCATLRAQMESAAVGKAKSFPWDKLFAPAKAAGLMDPDMGDGRSDGTDFDPGELDAQNARAARTPDVGRAPGGVGVHEPEPAEGEPCEHCGSAMGERDLTCSKCGSEYREGCDDQGPFFTMVRRPCAHCGALVSCEPLGEDRPCSKCGAVHDGDWKATLPPPPKEEPKPRRGGSRAKAAPAAPKGKAAEKPAPADIPSSEPDLMNWG